MCVEISSLRLVVPSRIALPRVFDLEAALWKLAKIVSSHMKKLNDGSSVAIIMSMSDRLGIRKASGPSRSVMIVSRFVSVVVRGTGTTNQKVHMRQQVPVQVRSVRYEMFRVYVAYRNSSFYNVPNRGKTSFRSKNDRDWFALPRTHPYLLGFTPPIV